MKQPEIAQLLTACGVPVFPCWDNKQPAVQGGFKSASTTPGEYWPSDLIGIPIPADILVIDIDTHKGMTTALIDQALNCQLDWDAAFLQNTPSGGAHYAFKVDSLMRQGSDLFWKEIGRGFDTRVTGRGYICAGGAYGSDDPIGVLKLAAPTSLPPLPPAAIITLTAQTETQHEPTVLPRGDRNSAEIETMIKCIDADCPRSEWLNVALALKHHYHDDDDTGWALFDNWSMTGGDTYDPVEARKLWGTIKAAADDGRASITLATIAHKAIENGYIPSSTSAELFGANAAQESAPLATMEQVVARINADGGNALMMDEITTSIRTLQCNDIQRAALRATLQRALKDHGIPIKPKDLEKATTPHSATHLLLPQPVASVVEFHNIPVSPVQALGNVHRQNARLLQQAIFGDRLALFDSMVRWWDGQCWSFVNSQELKRKVSAPFEGSEFGKSSVINGTEEQLHNVLTMHRSVNPVSQLIFFKNGVLDLRRPDLGVQAHDAKNFNTFTLTVDYEPGAPHPEWDKFLASIFTTEPERVLLLQEIFGWSMITDNLNHQKAAILDGKSRSGKGTCIEVLNAILGQAMIATPLDELHDHKHLSNMRNAIVATDTDAKGPHINDIRKVHGIFNKVTANEQIPIKLLWTQEPWVGRLNCKLVMASNGIPVISDDAGAAPNRWLILKFTESFLGREDRGLVQRLVAEKSAITAWAVEGLRRLMANGQFTIPESSRQETALLIESSSPISQFIEDRVELFPGESCHISTLYEAYKRWCREAGEYHTKRTNFRKSLLSILPADTTHYVDKVRINDKQTTGVMGIRLRPCADGVTAPNVTPIGKALKEAPKP